MGSAGRRGREERQARSVLTCLLTTGLALVGFGPMICVIVRQVCVSKCLLLRRLPKLSADMDDMLLVALFLGFLFFNVVTCCVTWSLVRQGFSRLSDGQNWLAWCLSGESESGDQATPSQTVLMDPKITRSGRPYGYRKARYCRSDL